MEVRNVGIENEEVEIVSERDGREEVKLGVVSKGGRWKEGRGNRRRVKDGGVEEEGVGRKLWGPGMEEHIMRRNLKTVREINHFGRETRGNTYFF